MGDGDTVSLWHETKAAHAGWCGEGLDLALGVAGAHVLAGAPDGGAIIAQGEGVDPLRSHVADLDGCRIAARLDNAAVVATGDEAIAECPPDQHDGVGMRGDALFFTDARAQDRAIGKGEGRGAAEKGRCDDFRAGGDRRDMLGEGGLRRSHRVLIQIQVLGLIRRKVAPQYSSSSSESSSSAVGM